MFLAASFPFQQRKTLLHLIVKKITLDNKKRVNSAGLSFNEETEKHFLSAAPSANNITEGAFLLPGKAPLLHQKLVITIWPVLYIYFHDSKSFRASRFIFSCFFCQTTIFTLEGNVNFIRLTLNVHIMSSSNS